MSLQRITGVLKSAAIAHTFTLMSLVLIDMKHCEYYLKLLLLLVLDNHHLSSFSYSFA